MSADLSRWFSGIDIPWEPGVYEREFPTGLYYSMWTGVQWLVASASPISALMRLVPSRHQTTVRWRGLAKDPKS